MKKYFTNTFMEGSLDLTDICELVVSKNKMVIQRTR